MISVFSGMFLYDTSNGTYEAATLTSGSEYVDNITIEVRYDTTKGVEDTATGDIDFFHKSIKTESYENLDDTVQGELSTTKKVDSYNNLLMNPAGNKTAGAGYCTQVDGEWQFNPFSIRKVRFAQNLLMNRDMIASEYYNGSADTIFTPTMKQNPAYHDHFDHIKDELGLTESGDLIEAKGMINEAMSDARYDPDLIGELRMGDDGYWEYKAPEGDWKDIQPIIWVRSEDKREMIGEQWVSNLREAGLNVEKRLSHEYQTQPLEAVYYSNPAKQMWHGYTDGWLIRSQLNKYREWELIRKYAPAGGHMPGLNGDYDWSYQNETLDHHAEILMNNWVENMSSYWGHAESLAEGGMRESVRVFLLSVDEVYLSNEDSVDNFITDPMSGWSDHMSIRTMKTIDGELNFTRYHSGALFQDPWNRFTGMGDEGGRTIRSMLSDPLMVTDPTEGNAMGLRTRFTENDVQMDYHFDENLTTLFKNVSVPSDALYYDTSNDTWETVGDGVKSAVSVTFDIDLGTWHNGQSITERDIAAWHAFAKEHAYDDGSGDDQYIDKWSQSIKTVYDDVTAIEWGEDDGEITVYGTHTFPQEGQIAMFYDILSAYKPWQVNEAADHLVRGTSYGSVTTFDYTWDQIDLLSQEQTGYMVDVLQNFKNSDWIPDYLNSSKQPNIPNWMSISSAEMDTQIDEIQVFFNEHDHLYISNGPFYVDNYNSDNQTMELSRWTQADGYPYPEDHWEDKLRIVDFELGTVHHPSYKTVGESVDVSIEGCEISEEYPLKTIEPADEGDVTVILKGNGVVEEFEADLVDAENGDFEVSIPGSVTEKLKSGTYTIEVVGTHPDDPTSGVKRSSIMIYENYVDVEAFDVYPTDGSKPLDVHITAKLNNSAGVSSSLELLVDDQIVDNITVPADETVEYEKNITLEELGDHTIRIGNRIQTVTVEEGVSDVQLSDHSVDPTSGSAPLTVSITAHLNNTGETSADIDVEVDGTVINTYSVDPGQTVQVDETHEFTETGSHTVKIMDRTVTVTVTEGEGDLVVNTLEVNKDEVTKGNEAVITYDLENTGDGPVDWRLVIAGETIDSGTLQAGESTGEKEYTHTFESEGEQVVKIVDGDGERKERTSITVKEDGIPGFTLVILPISAVIAFLVYRKKMLSG